MLYNAASRCFCKNATLLSYLAFFLRENMTLLSYFASD